MEVRLNNDQRFLFYENWTCSLVMHLSFRSDYRIVSFSLHIISGPIDFMCFCSVLYTCTVRFRLVSHQNKNKKTSLPHSLTPEGWLYIIGFQQSPRLILIFLWVCRQNVWLFEVYPNEKRIHRNHHNFTEKFSHLLTLYNLVVLFISLNLVRFEDFYD